MTYQINSFTTKTWQETHDDVLRTVGNGMIQLGITDNPQLGVGSDEELWARVIANETQPLYVNIRITADAQMPDTASLTDPPTPVGPDLTRLMGIKGLAPRPAIPSTGYITLACSATTSIASEEQLTDAAGLVYEVAASGLYANGALVPIVAKDTGPATNHAAGDILVWVSSPPFCNPKQPVATGGLEGGEPEENNETARARLLDREANPPGAGNWSQLAGYAEDSTALVQQAFVYPAAGGPSTVVIVVTGITLTRMVAASILDNVVEPYVLGKIFGGVEVTVNTVVTQYVDVAIGLTLPSAPTASPAGPGGGWVDGTPWPSISGVQDYANVTAITSTSQFTVAAPTPPTDGISHICMWDPSVVNDDGTFGAIVRATVLSHTGSAGAYVITIDTPFTNVVAQSGGDLGTLIFPDATNMDTYAEAFAAAMLGMGPGEVTTNASVLSRGFRHPTPQSSWPYSLNASQLKAIEDTGAEVLDTDWYYRSATTPTVPAAYDDPPYQLVARRVGIYPI